VRIAKERKLTLSASHSGLGSASKLPKMDSCRECSIHHDEPTNPSNWNKDIKCNEWKARKFQITHSQKKNIETRRDRILSVNLPVKLPFHLKYIGASPWKNFKLLFPKSRRSLFAGVCLFPLAGFFFGGGGVTEVGRIWPLGVVHPSSDVSPTSILDQVIWNEHTKEIAERNREGELASFFFGGGCGVPELSGIWPLGVAYPSSDISPTSIPD
jgi:hypothetical protein